MELWFFFIIVLQQLRRFVLAFSQWSCANILLTIISVVVWAIAVFLCFKLHFSYEGISDAIYDEVWFDMWFTTHAHFFPLVFTMDVRIIYLYMDFICILNIFKWSSFGSIFSLNSYYWFFLVPTKLSNFGIEVLLVPIDLCVCKWFIFVLWWGDEFPFNLKAIVFKIYQYFLYLRSCMVNNVVSDAVSIDCLNFLKGERAS